MTDSVGETDALLGDLRRFETTIDQMFKRAVARWPENIFVIADGKRISYAEMEALVERAARGLLALGVTPGDRVALWMSNIWEWIVVQFAVTRMGGVLAPLNTRLRSDDLAHALRDCGARVLVTQAQGGEFSYLETVRGILAAAEGNTALEKIVVARPPGGEAGAFLSFEDLLARGDAHDAAPVPAADPGLMAYILYTSGTTSLPKGVMLAHANLNNAINIAGKLKEGDLTFLAYPLFAITGCHNTVLASALVGGGLVLQERFAVEEAIDLIERHQCTAIGGIIQVVEEIVNAAGFTAARVASLRLAYVFPRRPEYLPVLRRLGIEAAGTGYGMTETAGPVASVTDLDPATMTCEGTPWPGNEVRIVGEDGRDMPPGQEGALIVRSPQVMLGYFNNPEATAKAVDGEGWLHTGDIGRFDDEGRLTWIGRHDDIYKCSGFNVATQEVESFLSAHPALEEVAVIGVPDAAKGEAGAAFVILKPGRTITLEALHEFCAGRIASYKIPAHLTALEEFPKTASGKVRKVELAKRHAAQWP